MFWASVFKSFGILLHWQVYLAIPLYLVISLLPYVFIFFSTKNWEENIAKMGCLIMLIQPFFQAFGVFVAVSTLFPILLGGDVAAWSLPWMLIVNKPGSILVLIIVMVMLSMLGAMIPIIGQTNSFSVFTLGGSVLVFLFRVINEIHPEYGIGNVDLIPGFFTIVGIVIVSAVVSWLGVMAMAALMTLVFRNADDSIAFFLSPLASVLGFFPVFIYASWVSLQLMGR